MFVIGAIFRSSLAGQIGRDIDIVAGHIGHAIIDVGRRVYTSFTTIQSTPGHLSASNGQPGIEADRI